MISQTLFGLFFQFASLQLTLVFATYSHLCTLLATFQLNSRLSQFRASIQHNSGLKTIQKKTKTKENRADLTKKKHLNPFFFSKAKNNPNTSFKRRETLGRETRESKRRWSKRRWSKRRWSERREKERVKRNRNMILRIGGERGVGVGYYKTLKEKKEKR
jgi:biopolymer transport protein ExbB/TolQ